MNKQRYNIDEALVQRYREGTLSEEEQAWLQEHPFEAEALEGLAETPQWSEDVAELQQRLGERTARQRSMWGVYSRYAAALALLITVGWFTYRFAFQDDFSVPIAPYQQPEAPAMSESFMSVPDSLEKVPGEGISTLADQSYIAQVQQSVKPVPVPKREVPSLPSAASSPESVENLALADQVEVEEENDQEGEYVLEAPVLSRKMSVSQKRARIAPPADPFGHRVGGLVYSADDRAPLPGVNVTVKGTLVATVTNVDGHFSVPVPDSTKTTLLFHSVGFLSEEIAIDQQDSLAIAMEPDVQALSEVVIVGYGSSDHALSQAAYPIPSRKAFREYLEAQLRYPTEAQQNGVEGTVKVQFTVEQDGELTNFQIKKSLGAGCDKEAIRLIQEGPAWQPAFRDGQPQPQQVTVKVRFKQ
uniref:TonB family protein n=1 Tax=Roseihalotalea indica TaxID=2867963 RepID=A0AA49GQS4_9BACT|nr:TonB family protein [Tunicatimonas sp. TK19036]